MTMHWAIFAWVYLDTSVDRFWRWLEFPYFSGRASTIVQTEVGTIRLSGPVQLSGSDQTLTSIYIGGLFIGTDGEVLVYYSEEVQQKYSSFDQWAYERSLAMELTSPKYRWFRM